MKTLIVIVTASERSNAEVHSVPRVGELICTPQGHYLKVLNVVHKFHRDEVRTRRTLRFWRVRQFDIQTWQEIQVHCGPCDFLTRCHV